MTSNLWLEYESLLTWMTGLSLIIFLVGLAITPFLIAAIPDDYFENKKRPKSIYTPLSLAWLIKKVFKNILGITLLLSGIAMLSSAWARPTHLNDRPSFNGLPRKVSS